MTVRFTRTHEWLRYDNGEEGIMGITHHAQELLGDMVFVELPSIGTAFEAGDEIGVVESVKAASDLYAPVSGIVVAVNQAAIDNPGIVNQDPFESGWLIKIKMNNPDEVSALLDKTQYDNEILKDA